MAETETETHTNPSPIRTWVRAPFRKLQKWCIRLAAASDKAYQLLAHSWWFSPGTPASSTTETGRHDIAEILLKAALNTINQIKYNVQLIWPPVLVCDGPIKKNL
jgi:hypothetical protein